MLGQSIYGKDTIFNLFAYIYWKDKPLTSSGKSIMIIIAQTPKNSDMTTD